MEVAASGLRPSCGPYEILAPLGKGGGGEVYRAWDPRLHREVALKILRGTHESDADRVRRFVAEARAAGALNHPNIVAVFDAAVDDDRPYIVTELIDGEPLRELIGRGPLPLARLLDLAAQIADGLAAAHDANIVHRDLKPENIVVARTGRAKIVDFGLARTGGFQGPGAALAPVSSGEQTVTESGLLAGTVPYMSPEQARGAEIDFRSDQFSFGLILHEMATGRHPFPRDTPAATLDAIINDELPPIVRPPARLPVLLRWIIERCLAKEPGDRYAATSDLYRDLRRLRDRAAESLLQEPAAAVPPILWPRRRSLAAAGVLLALVIGTFAWGTTAEPQPFDPSRLRFRPIATDPAYEGFPAFSPDGQTIAYAADVNGVLQIFTRGLSSPVAARLTDAPYDCKHPFWSPDGRRIYYVSRMRDRDGIWSIPSAGGLPQPVLENASRAAISPDGRTVAFLRDEERADVVGTAALWLSTPPGGELIHEAVEAAKRRYQPFEGLRFVEGALWFSPDGRKLGLCAVPLSLNLPPEERGWQFWVLPLSGGEPVRRLQAWSEVAPRVSSFSWLPDSRHVVLGAVSLFTPGSDLWLADLEKDRAWALTRSPESYYYPSASSNGPIVFTKDEGDYDLVAIDQRGDTQPLLASARNESEPAWSRVDPSLFAYVTDRSGQDEIWLKSLDGRVDRPVITQQEFGGDRTILLSSPTFSPDGQQIAFLRNGSRPIWPLRIWYAQVAGGPPVELMPQAREGYHGAPTWSPDGQWMTFAEWKDERWSLVKVRVGSGEPPEVLRSDGVANATPRWSPRNEWITWETTDAFLLVSPDGQQEQILTEDQWLVHEWSTDGFEVVGIKETEDLRLALISVDIRTGSVRLRADLGPSAPVNRPVRGLALAADGRAITSTFRLRGDLWLLDGLSLANGAGRRFWRSP
ncbi:MAG TPA: protein kinase [Longimicrobiales bacterium]|nr:protein kinase [Longimicrobiales bacterium]